MCNNELINYQSKLYYVYRKISSKNIKEEHIQDVKDFFMCDIVVRHTNQSNDILFFMREIPELEIIE